MNSQQTTFEQKWLQGMAFQVAQPLRFAYLCPLAESFAAWCETQVAPVRASPTEVTVNQALLLLQEQFLARWEAAPRAHRTLGSAQHTCLFGVYLDYCRELRELRWQVNPPLVREPVPARPQVNGIFLGEAV
jgi:hypothetical protein